MRAVAAEDEWNDTYGRSRMHDALKLKDPEADIPSERTVYRIMEGIGLRHRPQRKPNGITKTDKLPSAYEVATTDYSFTEQLSFTLQEETAKYGAPEKPKEKVSEVAKFVASYASRSVMDLSRQVKTYDAVHDEETRAFVKKTVIAETMRQFPEMDLKKEELEVAVEKAIETCVQALTNRVIPIPQTVVQPFTEVKQGFTEISLDTRSLNWHPFDDTLLGTELQEGGRTFTFDSERMAMEKRDTVENEIIRFIIVHDNVDYASCADLLYSLVADAKRHFLSYLTEEETEKVMHDRQKTLADIIYAQMNEHFYHEEINYRASKMRPFSRIETGFGGKFKSGEIYDLRANIKPGEVKSKVFSGFNKFDSGTKRDFAIVLENDGEVQKWMRPAAKQFDIYYGPGGVSRYEPDFIVETAGGIFMVETKASNEMDSETVLQKARAAMKFCQAVSEWNAENGGKPWEYALISHDEMRINSSFKHLIAYKKAFDQMQVELDLKK